MAVVVVIAPDATEAVTRAGDACLWRNVGEREVAVVAIERVAGNDAFIVKIAAVHEVNVLISVTVVVGDANSGAENFQIGGDTVVAAEVGKGDAGGGGGAGAFDGIWPQRLGARGGEILMVREQYDKRDQRE